jgi:hypothetical protein
MCRGQIGIQEILDARAQLTGDMEQRARDQEAEDATIWVRLGVDSQEVDNEVTGSSEITLSLRRSQQLRDCKYLCTL